MMNARKINIRNLIILRLISLVMAAARIARVAVIIQTMIRAALADTIIRVAAVIILAAAVPAVQAAVAAVVAEVVAEGDKPSKHFGKRIGSEKNEQMQQFYIAMASYE